MQYVVEDIPIDNLFYRDFVSQMKIIQDGVLYDREQSPAGFKWHIFAKQGVAFLASSFNGYTIRVLRFPSTDYQTFVRETVPVFSLSSSR